MQNLGQIHQNLKELEQKMCLNFKQNLEAQNQAQLHQILADLAQILHGAVV